MIKSKFRPLRKLFTQANNSFYVTTPIFYVNAAPHIGHLYSAVIADALVRYQQLRQPQIEATLCTGTDEHGSKIQQAAARHNIPVAQYCQQISESYKNVFNQAQINYSDFIRTSEERHKQAVAHFWNTLQTAGHIYSAQYSGWYCVSDETFLTDSQLKIDAASGSRFSLESGHPVEWFEETNYMFRLSNMQAEIINWLKKGKKVRPIKFERILLDMLAEPLPDVSVSRPSNRVHWAIPVPGDNSQTVYVWLDALINYLTSVGYPDSRYLDKWPPKVQVIGKDILKFHGIYWPAFLMAADIEPPQQLFVHSHWTVEGQKMSKSKGNVVDPLEASKTYTMEGLRYFLLREGVAHSDGNYSSIKALRILNSELADTLGNLLSRACAKSLNPKQIYPCLQQQPLTEILQHEESAQRLQDAIIQLEERCRQHYDSNNFYLAVDTIISTLHAANNFFESLRPWELKNKNATSSSDEAVNIEKTYRLETIICMTMDALRLCGIALQPIVPQLSASLLDKLQVPQQERLWHNLSQHFASSHSNSYLSASAERALSSSTDAVLFRRIQLEEACNEGEKATASKKPKQPQPAGKAKKQKNSKKIAQ